MAKDPSLEELLERAVVALERLVALETARAAHDRSLALLHKIYRGDLAYVLRSDVGRIFWTAEEAE